jgi:RNA recognition motif. (a.k.a. RRM, RBD, or RNP domain)
VALTLFYALPRCSVYVGQVDYSATPEELLAHFEACGTVERVTIVCDKMTGRPKGFAYLEFQVRRIVCLFSNVKPRGARVCKEYTCRKTLLYEKK